MTNDKMFFDTDCLSSFLMINDTDLLVELFGGKIILPKQVYKELSNPCVRDLKCKTDILKKNGDVKVEGIETNTKEWDLYYKLTNNPDKGHIIIGAGEAAAIAMTKERGGILASNNLKDVKKYVEEFGLEHITAADIIYVAFQREMISEDDGNTMWMKMLLKRRKLPTTTFTEYMNHYKSQ